MNAQPKSLNPDPAEIIAEPKKPAKKPVEVQAPQVLVSNTDAYIYDRLRGQPQTLEDVEVKVVGSKKDGVHQLSLPEELKIYEDRFAFYWIYKNKKAIDRACDVRCWTIVSRVHFSDLPAHLFTVNGCMERGDNILGFMPRKRAEELRRNPGQISSDIVKSQFNKHKDDPRYYAPKDDESERVVMI